MVDGAPDRRLQAFVGHLYLLGFPTPHAQRLDATTRTLRAPLRHPAKLVPEAVSMPRGRTQACTARAPANCVGRHNRARRVRPSNQPSLGSSTITATASNSAALPNLRR